MIKRKNKIITGLDIGSSKISAVLAEVDSIGMFRVISHVTSDSSGISRGLFSDIRAGVNSVAMAIAKLQEKSGIGLGDIYVNISGNVLKAARSKGMIAISLRGREITKADMEKCVNVASVIQLPFDREIIHKIVHRFSIDDQQWIKDPHGLYASRLSCEVYIISASVNHMQNIHKCVNDAGFDIEELVFTGIAEGSGLLTQEDREKGVAILNIGASLAEFSIFSSGVLDNMDIIPLGSDDIKGDFASSGALNAILKNTGESIKSFISEGGKLDRVVLTGGIAFADGLLEYLESSLSYPVKMGVVKDLRGDISSIDSLRLTTALGLARYGYEKHMKAVHDKKNITKRFSEKVVDIFNNYF